MSCTCTNDLTEGIQVVDHVKSKGKDKLRPIVMHEMHCDCGETFHLQTVIMNCPKCEMTYAVTPCGSADIENVKQAGIKYA